MTLAKFVEEKHCEAELIGLGVLKPDGSGRRGWIQDFADELAETYGHLEVIEHRHINGTWIIIVK